MWGSEFTYKGVAVSAERRNVPAVVEARSNETPGFHA